MNNLYKISTDKYNIYKEDCLNVLKNIEENTIQLVLTSPPYNLGKSYETKKSLDNYLKEQEIVIKECHRILKDTGSIAWQTGNWVNKSEIYPLDIYFYDIFKKLGMKLRNRIIWNFNHGLHCKKRLSGRYETVLWFSKYDDYVFNLDSIRIPQKYPNKKHFKGKKKGQLSCNPLGKNPGDVWEITNVKHNHPEKTDHPCQYPLELCNRLILSLSNKNDIVLDPYLGSGTTAVASVNSKRRFIGSENNEEYMNIIYKRLENETENK